MQNDLASSKLPRNAFPALLAALLLGWSAGVGYAEVQGSLSIASGFGYDSNAFLTPDAPYFDPLRNEVVNPRKREGVFVPVNLRAELEGDSKDPLRLFGRYRLDWEEHISDRTQNADNHRSRLDLGLEYRFRRVEGRWSRLRFGPALSYNREIYFDPDTGEIPSFGEEISLAERYNYRREGLTADLRLPFSRAELTVDAAAAKYDYVEVERLSSLDHRYYKAAADLSFRVLAPTRLGAGYSYWIRDFDSRPPQNSAGNLERGEERRYEYHRISGDLRHALSGSWRLSLEYARTWRLDDFVGYDDYRENRLRSAVSYAEAGRRIDLRLAYWTRRYPNAFIFDLTPTSREIVEGRTDFAPRKKSYDGWDAELSGELPLTKPWKLWAAYEFTEQNAKDSRYEYRRHQVQGGLKVEL
jgi:hypothetical protein